MEKHKINFIDLFSGAGGLSYGLSKSGLQGILAIEKNSDAFETFKHNILNKELFLWPDNIEIKGYDVDLFLKEYKSELQKYYNIDLVVGGPPCQGFSLAGKRDSDDERNKLSFIYLDYIRILKPKMIFIENVEGYNLSFHKNDDSMATKIEDSLKKLGYSTCSKMINMKNYGVPQSRKRYILFASKSFCACNFFASLNKVSKVFLEKYDLDKEVTLEEAIGDLFKGKQRKKSGNFVFGKYRKITSSYQRFVRKDNLEATKPDSHRFVNHYDKTIDKFKDIMKLTSTIQRSLTNQERKDLSITKRNITALKKDSVCRTITSIPDDYIHYKEARVMTPRECARIQGFPDDFHFLGKYTTGGKLRKIDVPRYTQIANAVPPIFAIQVGLAIKELKNNEQTSI
jgi:DNA (cytosine-5)-methyltransferase 1